MHKCMRYHLTRGKMLVILRVNMDLLGRDEDLLVLNQFLSREYSGNLVLHGHHGVGKSYLLAKVAKNEIFPDVRSFLITIRDPLAPAQAFLKDLVTVLLTELTPKEKENLLNALRETFGSGFSIQRWREYYRDHYLSDGYIFMRIIRCLREVIGQKILFLIDQVEELGPESRILLRNVVEWKPEGIFFLLGLTTTGQGKESIIEEYGHQFFFKANHYLELQPISNIFEESFKQVYGIENPPSNQPFMTWALQQKRLWLHSHCQSDQVLRQLSCFLAHFPAGLVHDRNPHLAQYLERMKFQPLLSQIFTLEGEKLSFAHPEFIQDVVEKFESGYDAMREEALDSLEPGRDFSQRLVKEIETYGVASTQTLELAQACYLETSSLSVLYDLCDASLSETYPTKIKEGLESHKGLSNLGLRFSEESYNAFRPLYTHKLAPEERAKFLPSLLSAFKKHRQLDRFISCFVRPEFIPLEAKLLAQIAWEKLRHEGSGQDDFLDSFAKKLPKEPFNSLKKMLAYLASDKRDGAQPPDIEDYFPVMRGCMWAAYHMERQDYPKADLVLQEAVSDCLKSQNFQVLSYVLTLLSECCLQLGDTDRQLSFYREAVIAEQFLP
jgi:hypothetical protein